MNIIEFAKFKKMFGGGGGSGEVITHTSTTEEMDAVLETATDEMVGSFYRYNGETTEEYENGALYAIGKKEV